MSAARTALLAQLDSQRTHVLAAVEGLSEEQLRLTPIPSGWSVERLLSHLLWDDEVFWIGAVLAGKADAIAELRNGWTSTDPSGRDVIDSYRQAVTRHDELLAEIDLDRAPAWQPPPEVFPGPPFANGWQLIHRVVVETATHAGHLDIARELIDGRRYLVVS